MENFEVRDLLISVTPGTGGWGDEGLWAAEPGPPPPPDRSRWASRDCHKGGSVTRSDPSPCRSTTESEPECKAGGSVTVPTKSPEGEHLRGHGFEATALDVLRADLRLAMAASRDETSDRALPSA
jgi:hypothetical protein